MAVRKGKNGRLVITGVDKELCMQYRWTDKGNGTFTCYDSWINRMLLALPLDRPQLPIKFYENDKLRQYQIEDILKMASQPFMLNANDMGLGKTVEAIELCRLLKCGRILVVAPKSVLTHWETQFNLWWPGLNILINPLIVNDDTNVLIINYEKLRSAEYVTYLEWFDWDCIIADEAHRIKNRKALQTKGLKGIHARYKYALTGTPILNKPDDLYSILQWLNPEIVGDSYWQFAQLFCAISRDDFGEHILGLTKDTGMRLFLETLMKLVMIRRTKMEVLTELPAKSVYTVDFDMPEKMKKLYKDTKELIFKNLPEHLTIANAAVHLLRLQQITSNPSQFVNGIPNAKFDYILDLAEDNPDKQIVVFAKFVDTVECLYKECIAHGISATTYTGDMSTRVRNSSLEDFMAGHARLLIATIASAGQGIDGLQYVCDTAVFIDADWSPSLNEQAEDRLCRLGQNYPVTIYYLQYKKSVDKYVGQKIALKEEDIKTVWNEL